MLKKRLIPKLLIRHRKIGGSTRPVLVTTRSFREEVEVGDAVSQAKIYEAQLADELIVLNIGRSAIVADEVMLQLIERLSSETFMPICVGGGVRAAEDFETLLQRGADKVSVNTAALENPKLITQAATRYGAQCVVVSIDFRSAADGSIVIMSDRAKAPNDRGLLSWAREAVSRGAGELFVTDADRDGSGEGLNTAMLAEVADAVAVPVIVSGGCGRAEHFVDGFRSGRADAVAAGTFFCFRDQNPMQTRAHIRNAGIPIRMET